MLELPSCHSMPQVLVRSKAILSSWEIYFTSGLPPSSLPHALPLIIRPYFFPHPNPPSGTPGPHLPSRVRPHLPHRLHTFAGTRLPRPVPHHPHCSLGDRGHCGPTLVGTASHLGTGPGANPDAGADQSLTVWISRSSCRCGSECPRAPRAWIYRSEKVMQDRFRGTSCVDL